MDFASTFVSQSEDGIKCSGAFNRRGVGSMTCTNGWKMNLAIPKDKYGTLNGTNVETSDGIGVPTGWDSAAHAELLPGQM